MACRNVTEWAQVSVAARCHGYIAHHARLRTDRPILRGHRILSRPTGIHRVRQRRVVGGVAARPADAAPDAPTPGPRPGRRGPARGDPRPVGPRPLGPTGRPACLLDDGIRPAGDRASRPPGGAPGRRRRYLVGGQRLARGRRHRTRAGARPDRRDAGPQQRGGGRDPGLRAADVRRPVPAFHGQRRPAADPADPAWAGPLLGGHRPRHLRPACRFGGGDRARTVLRADCPVVARATPHRGAGADRRAPCRPDPPGRGRRDARRRDAPRHVREGAEHPGVAGASGRD